MKFDPASGFVRYVCLGRIEVLRGVYVAVRDRNWGTVAPVISDLVVEEDDVGFRITFSAECRQGPIDFVWRGSLTGDNGGALHYTMDGLARSTFLRNRIGFCALHPIAECAGRSCTVEKVDGSVEEGQFPRFISPHQPLQSIRAISHDVTPGVRATVRFEGDVFEMEDQRNWSDASFKTYGTPLALPYPAEIAAGTTVRQAVTLRLEGIAVSTREPSLPAEPVVEIRRGGVLHLPRLGLGIASHDRSLTVRELDRLRKLRLDHLRVDVTPSAPGGLEPLCRAAREAAALNCSLQVGLHFSDSAAEELRRVVELVEHIHPPVSAWLVFPINQPATTISGIELARNLLKPATPQALVGGGTNANFAELNRGRLPPGVAEVVCYSVNPQVHAFDDASMVETLEAQPQMVASARQFAGGAPIAVGPITLRPRFNAVATGPETLPPPGELPPQVDPRQCSLLAAGWTLGSIAGLAAGGASSATYYETTGWRGIMEAEEDSPPPELRKKFPSIPGGAFPVWHVLADLAEIRGEELFLLQTSDRRKVVGIAAGGREKDTLLVANVTEEPQTVRIIVDDGFGGGAACVRMLDGRTVEQAVRSPEDYRAAAGRAVDLRRWELPPYAIARVEIAKEPHHE